MTIAYQDILQTAHTILATGSTEADFRASIGRSYYAAYHCCVKFHSTLATPGIAAPSGSGGEHENLIHRLIKPTDVSKKQVSLQVGYILRGMKFARHDADYKLAKTFSRQQAEQWHAEAIRLSVTAV